MWFAPLVSSFLHILLKFDPSSCLLPLHSVGEGTEREGEEERKRGKGIEGGRGEEGRERERERREKGGRREEEMELITVS